MIDLALASPEHHIVRLREHTNAQVDLISFGAASPREVDRVAQRLVEQDQGRLLVAPHARGGAEGGYATTFFDCDGRTIEVVADVAARSFVPAEPGVATPVALSHVVLNTSDIDRSVSFYMNVLGMMVSDWLDNYFCFLRTGPSHHAMAFTAADHASLNHFALEYLGVDEFMRATGSMLQRQHALLWGPGRHEVGDNAFAYFREPTSGFIVEYTTPLQVVGESWQPTRYTSDDQAADLWGTSNELTDEIVATMHGAEDPGLWQHS